MSEFQVIRILFFAALSFIFTVLWTPLLTHVLYKYKLGKQIRNNGSTPLYTRLHAHKSGTPTMGGVLIWVTTFIFAIFFFYLSILAPWGIIKNLNFLSRAETLLPLGALLATALVGLFDDWLNKIV